LKVGENDMSSNHDVQQFLYREARLMDEHRYDDWLALWTPEAHYWLPCKDEDGGLDSKIALVNEDIAGLQDRIKRLKSGAHYAQDPKSRMSRIVSNVEIVGEDGEAVTVASVFNLTTVRRGKVEVVAGRALHRLKPVDGDLRMASKKIYLVGNNDVMTNLTYLV
jgi:3-phenylpropionate/cinnamic acid dioxygenase small subunit